MPNHALALEAAAASFSHEATRMGNLLSMAGGSFAFQSSKLFFLQGARALHLSSVLPSSFTQAIVCGLATGVEVTCFRGLSHFFESRNSANFFREALEPVGWTGTFNDFSVMKLLSPLGRNNPILASWVQSNAMVLGREVSTCIGLIPQEQGSYLERLAIAQAQQISMGAGSQLFHAFSGGRLRRMEQSFETRSHSSANILPRQIASASFLRMRENGDTNALKDFLRSRRQEIDLSEEQACARMQAHLPEFDIGKLQDLETRTVAYLDFNILNAFARSYELNIDSLVRIANASSCPELNPQIWESFYGPLYIEFPSDRARLEDYALKDPERKSLGWLLYSFRKNPNRYHSNPEALAARLGVEEAAWHVLERNDGLPSLERLPTLIEIVGDEAKVMEAYNHNVNPAIEGLLATVFPGRRMLIQNKSGDFRKLQLYAANSSAPGRLAFLARKTHHPFSSTQKSSQHLSTKREGRQSSKDRVEEFENRMGALTPGDLPNWFHYFKEMGAEPALLHSALPETIKVGSAAYQLAIAMNGESERSLLKRAGIGQAAFRSVLYTRRRAKPATLLALCRALPRLNPWAFCFESLPLLKEFLPEAREEGIIQLSDRQWAKLQGLQLANLLPAHRVFEGTSGSGSPETGQNAKSSNSAVTAALFDRRLVSAIRRLAKHNHLDPKVVFLALYPQFFQVMKICNPETGHVMPIESESYRLLEAAAPVDPGYLAYARIGENLAPAKPAAAKTVEGPKASAPVELGKSEHFATLESYYRNLISRCKILADNPRDPMSEKRYWIQIYQKFNRCTQYLRDHNPQSAKLKRFERLENAASRQLLLSDIRFVVKIAQRYGVRGEEFWDLVQEGCMGLFKAAKDFDLRRGTKFNTYSTWWIRKSMTDYVIQNIGHLRIPKGRHFLLRRLFKELQQLDNAGKDMAESLERVAQSMELSESEIGRLRSERLLQEKVSTDAAQANGDPNDISGRTLLDMIADSGPDPAEQVAENNLSNQRAQIIEEFRGRLSSTQRYVFDVHCMGLSEEEALEQLGPAFQSPKNQGDIKSKLLRMLRRFIHERGIINSKMERGNPLPTAPSPPPNAVNVAAHRFKQFRNPR